MSITLFRFSLILLLSQRNDYKIKCTRTNAGKRDDEIVCSTNKVLLNGVNHFMVHRIIPKRNMDRKGQCTNSLHFETKTVMVWRERDTNTQNSSNTSVCFGSMVRVCKSSRDDMWAHTKQTRTLCANDNKQLTKNRSGNSKHVSPLFCFSFTLKNIPFSHISLCSNWENKAHFSLLSLVFYVFLSGLFLPSSVHLKINAILASANNFCDCTSNTPIKQLRC